MVLKKESIALEQKEHLKNQDVDHVEKFLIKHSFSNLLKFNKGTIVNMKFYKVNVNLNKSILIDEMDTIEIEGDNDEATSVKVLEYNYFDCHQLRIDLDISGTKKSFNICIFSILQHKLKEIKLPIDLNSKEEFIEYSFDKENLDYSDNLPLLTLNFERKTRLLNFNVYTFNVEFTLDTPSIESRKLAYTLYLKNKDKLSIKLFESKETVGKKKFLFNLAFIKRSDLYGNAEEESMILFDVTEGEKIIGEASISFNSIKNLKLNEINSIKVIKNEQSTEEKAQKPSIDEPTVEPISGKLPEITEPKSEGYIKLVQREINPTQLYEDITQGLQFKFTQTIDLCAQFHFDNSTLNAAYDKVLNSLGKIIPYYNVKDFTTHVVGLKDEANNEFGELKLQPGDYYKVDNLIKAYDNDIKGKQMQMLNPTQLVLQSYLKFILKLVKANKAKEYSIYVIIINGPLEDEKECKDIFVELSKFSVSLIFIGLKSVKDQNGKFGFLSSISKIII